jgi:hypothetical protein
MNGNQNGVERNSRQHSRFIHQLSTRGKTRRGMRDSIGNPNPTFSTIVSNSDDYDGDGVASPESRAAAPARRLATATKQQQEAEVLERNQPKPLVPLWGGERKKRGPDYCVGHWFLVGSGACSLFWPSPERGTHASRGGRRESTPETAPLAVADDVSCSGRPPSTPKSTRVQAVQQAAVALISCGSGSGSVIL